MKFPNRASKLFSKFAFFAIAPLSLSKRLPSCALARVDGAAREKREADAPTDVRRT